MVLVFKRTSFYLIMAPKYKTKAAGNADLPKRSCKMLLQVEMENTVKYFERDSIVAKLLL